MELSKEDRKALKDSGMTGVVLVEETIVYRGTNRLLRGRSAYGETLWGTWVDGEAAEDIRWQREKHNA